MVDATKVDSSNPQMLNQLAAKAMNNSEPEKQPYVATVQEPNTNTLVNLPGGYVSPAGEVIKTAEVRELTGKDEELISKSSDPAKVYTTLLERAVVSIGDYPATQELLDNLLVGDRDALLLGIYRVTFGSIAELTPYCFGCEEAKTAQFDVDEDIEVKTLRNPATDREFEIQGKLHKYLVTMPTGITQKEMAANSSKTIAELTTLLLEQTVLEIDGEPVISKLQVQGMGLADRRKIDQEIKNRAPGPQFNDAHITCPDCDGKVVVPINLGTLFQF